MTVSIDRTAWPWHSAPNDVTDYDEATWHASRRSSQGQLPRQSIGRWVLEQRARRSRDVLEPAPMTEADREQLRADLIAAWAHPVPTRYVGRLPR
jgi:hypothetical protein